MGTGSYLRDSLATIHDQLYCGLSIPSPVNDRVILLRAALALTGTITKAQLIAGEVTTTGYSRALAARKIVSVSGNFLTIPEHNIPDGTPVFLLTKTGASATGLSTGVRYYTMNATGNTLQLSLSVGGAVVPVTVITGDCYLKLSGAYDTTDSRFEALYDPAPFTITGGLITYQGHAVLRDASDKANVNITAIDPATDQFTTASAHNLEIGEEVMISHDTTMPGGVSASTIYYARSIGASVFTIYPTLVDALNDVNRVNVTDTGAGTARLLYAKGTIDGYEYSNSSATINDGRTHTIRIYRNVLNAGTLTGVA